MKMKRTEVTEAEVVLWVVCLLLATLISEYAAELEDILRQHVTVFVALLLGGGVAVIIYAIVGMAPPEAPGCAAQLPQTWTRPVQDEPPCVLCGSGRTCFFCDDHNLILCAACSQRHDERYHCHIRYVPTMHESSRSKAHL